MRETPRIGSILVPIALMLAALLLGSTAARAQTVIGHAKAVQANVLGTTTLLADTGTLAAINDSRDAALVTSTVPSLLSGEVLSAGTMSWSDEVDSEASLASLNLTVGGSSITADFVMSQASRLLSTKSSGTSIIDGLSINGTPITVTGAANQKVAIPGGYVVINEQKNSANRITVNALHIVVTGVANVVIGSATAGIY